MPELGDTKGEILGLLSDYKPRSFSDIVKEMGLGKKVIEGALYRLWRDGRILRMKKPLMEAQRIFKGRGGITHNLRKYHLYLIITKEKITMSGIYGDGGHSAVLSTLPLSESLNTWIYDSLTPTQICPYEQTSHIPRMLYEISLVSEVKHE